MSLFIEKPYLLALLISLILALWLLSGQSVEDTTATTMPTSVSSPKSRATAIQVRVREQQAEPLSHNIVLTGRTAPLRTATLRAEINARVVEIGAKRGARLEQGDMIVRLATEDRELRLIEAQALVKQREFEYQAKQNLSKQGYQSKIQIAEALTWLENAKTQVKQAQIALENTLILAPFDGVLVQRLVEEGDYVSMSDPIAELMDEDPFLIIGEVAERQRSHLKLGSQVTAHLVTGQTVTGKIRLIASRADTATRTFPIEIEIPNSDGEIAANITSEIRIPLQTILAHKVSAALLSLNDAGLLGIKAVSAANRVVFYPAELARATAKGIWLTGLPRKSRFIVVGQGFVRAGDNVQPILESPSTNQ